MTLPLFSTVQNIVLPTQAPTGVQYAHAPNNLELFHQPEAVRALQGIHLSKCIPFMQEKLPTASVDFVCADPPYGVDFQSNAANQGNRKDRATVKKPKIDGDDKPYTEWLTEAARVLKPSGALITFYDWRYQAEFIEAIKAAGLRPAVQMVWDRKEIGMGNLDLPGPSHELMLFCVHAKGSTYKVPGKRPRSVYSVPRVNSNKLFHPNQKPVELMRELLIDYTLPHQIVFDPFGGSFAVQKAADATGRIAISTESSQYYFDLGKKNYSAQPLIPFEGALTKKKPKKRVR